MLLWQIYLGQNTRNAISTNRQLVFHFALSISLVTLCCGAPAQSAALPKAFDVASIRVNKTASDGRHHIYSNPAESQFRAVNLSLRDLLQFAFDLPDSQILGGPAWLDLTMFDVDAKSDPSVDTQLHGLPGEQARIQKRLMVQALLADRFLLKAHPETRQLPLYALIVAKGGPRFKPSQVNGTTIDSWRTHLHVAGSDDTIGLLARALAQQLGGVVENRTGLSGRFDLSLQWTPDDAVDSAPSSANAPPGIFDAIQEQLGLALESKKGPVPVLVIDRIEVPSAN